MSTMRQVKELGKAFWPNCLAVGCAFILIICIYGGGIAAITWIVKKVWAS